VELRGLNTHRAQAEGFSKAILTAEVAQTAKKTRYTAKDKYTKIEMAQVQAG